MPCHGCCDVRLCGPPLLHPVSNVPMPTAVSSAEACSPADAGVQVGSASGASRLLLPLSDVRYGAGANEGTSLLQPGQSRPCVKPPGVCVSPSRSRHRPRPATGAVPRHSLPAGSTTRRAVRAAGAEPVHVTYPPRRADAAGGPQQPRRCVPHGGYCGSRGPLPRCHPGASLPRRPARPRRRVSCTVSGRVSPAGRVLPELPVCEERPPAEPVSGVPPPHLVPPLLSVCAAAPRLNVWQHHSWMP